MRIEITREACCSQDDQTMRLSMELNIGNEMTIQNLARSIGEANFLQFTGTHCIVYVSADESLLFSIPALSIDGSRVEYFVDKNESALKYVHAGKVYCLWSKQAKWSDSIEVKS